MPRQLEWTQSIADAICERLAEGESLRAICKDEAMPALSSVFKWLDAVPGFADQYARAREQQAETLAAEIVAIADEAAVEDVVVDGVAVGVKLDSTAVARNRLRVDARKWVAAKLKPKVYGDKVTTEHTGPNGGPVQVADVSSEALDARIAALQAALKS
jgi:hypothetical protein